MMYRLKHIPTGLYFHPNRDELTNSKGIILRVQ